MYAELHCHSAFSLLDGASTPEALVARAAQLSYPAIALTDHNELGGAVRFGLAAQEAGINGILGAELTVTVPDQESGTRPTHLVLLAETRAGYRNISTLITRARMDSVRGSPAVPWSLVASHADGITALTGCTRGWVPQLLAEGREQDAWRAASQLREVFGNHMAIECWDHCLAEERALVKLLRPLSERLGVPWVVTNDVHYARPQLRMIHDVLTALRHGATLDEMGTELRPNAEWSLKSPSLVLRRWRGAEEGVRATVEIAERCTFTLTELRPSLPVFPLPPGVTADGYLERLVDQGANERWGAGRSPEHNAQLSHELGMIFRLKLAGYFLIVWDIVRFAMREGILCQGRGSAANSAVCYCLGITAVDPVRMKLLFERFLTEEREEAPDIDIDFAHRDRERVLQYVYNKYGREHAAMVCEQITWRGRSAVRDAARVLGFSEQQGDALSAISDRRSARKTAAALRVAQSRIAADAMQPAAASAVAHTKTSDAAGKPVSGTSAYADARETLLHIGLDPDDMRVRLLADMVEGLDQLPRHRSIHVGGFVLSEEPLGSIVPLEPASMPGRTVIQWEKDDLDPAGLIKIDLLGLGMLTVVQDCLAYVLKTRGTVVDPAQLDMADPAVYDDLCRADSVGVFQVESRAQMNTLPRLKPRCFYDLVVEVALIRPGPIQGDMVHPYLRRRAGEEAVTYPHPSLKPILERTLGVPLFQEQGMQVAIAAAGFTPSQADQLRRAMGHKRSRERMAAICEQLIEGMERNGIPAETGRRIYNQINAFADYGFPESHAASFALIVYTTAYLRHYYAPEYLAAILNAQPMGFYSPGTLIEDAKRHGVHVLPVDLTHSAWNHTLELSDGRVLVPHERETEWRVACEPAPAAKIARAHGHPTDPAPDPASDPAPEAVSVRLGMRIIRGLGARARAILESALKDGPFADIEDAVERAKLDTASWRRIAESGAFDSMFTHLAPERRRRAALWEVMAVTRQPSLPFAPRTRTPVPDVLKALTRTEITEADLRVTGVALGGHPMKHLRSLLEPNGVLTAEELRRHSDGEKVAVAGLVICRQRPPTAKGFAFLTLEDESGMTNVVITPGRFEREAELISTAPLLLIRGTLQIANNVVNVRAEKFRQLIPRAGEQYKPGRNFI